MHTRMHVLTYTHTDVLHKQVTVTRLNVGFLVEQMTIPLTRDFAFEVCGKCDARKEGKLYGHKKNYNS
jgi:hypothetical protein